MKVVVVGGGAAGMMAAISAAQNGAQVTLLEHNEKLGKKIYITGKGRCNFTNACEIEKLFESVVTNPKFLYSAFYTFSNEDVMAFFEQAGVPYKIERGDRAFPQSDKSSDIIAAMTRKMKALGVDVVLNAHVHEIVAKDGAVSAVKTSCESYFADRVILATGGKSYVATGSDGSGYLLSQKLGHTVTELRPALVPILFCNPPHLEGLSLRNVGVSVCQGKRTLALEQGEMLFTAKGVSGPVVLTLSSKVNKKDLTGAMLCIDLKPALTREQVDDRVLRDFAKYANKDFGNALDDLLPKSLIPEFVARCEIPPYKKVHQITAQERTRIVDLLKNLCYSIKCLDSIEYGIVTSGGVSVKEIDPTTMQSKLVKGLYFAGEVIDLDALTGGYNLQIAFSTGYLAGMSCVEET